MSRQAGGADLASPDFELIVAMSSENRLTQIHSWRLRDTCVEAELGDVHARITAEGIKLTGMCHSASCEGNNRAPALPFVSVQLGLVDEGPTTGEHRHPMCTTLCVCQRHTDGKRRQGTGRRACTLNPARSARTDHNRRRRFNRKPLHSLAAFRALSSARAPQQHAS